METLKRKAAEDEKVVEHVSAARQEPGDARFSKQRGGKSRYGPPMLVAHQRQKLSADYDLNRCGGHG